MNTFLKGSLSKRQPVVTGCGGAGRNYRIIAGVTATGAPAKTNEPNAYARLRRRSNANEPKPNAASVAGSGTS